MTAAIDSAMLQRRWVHSHEEDTEDHMVFRPASYPFPPSRGRRSLDLQPDHVCMAQEPGAADAPIEHAMHWHVDQQGILVIQGGPAHGQPEAMQIVSVDDSRLVIRK